MRLTRRLLLALGVVAPFPVLAAEPTPAHERRVGIGYALWHSHPDWTARSAGQQPWGRPELGYYLSNDPAILTHHAAWLTEAKVDFVLVDWSNDLGTDTRTSRGPPDQLFIEHATTTLCETWSQLPRHPQIAFLIGVPGPMLRAGVVTGAEDLNAVTHNALQQKADQVYEQYVRKFEPAIETYLGKPLLVVMIGVPTPYRTRAPTWTDPRFTVRFMSAYLSEFPGLTGADRVSRLGYWSWEDRGPPSYAVYQGSAEAMTVVAAWRDDRPGIGGRARRGGATYREGWARARQIGPRYVLAGTFNEWWVSEQINAQAAKDVEPSDTFGHQYLDILAQEASAYKR